MTLTIELTVPEKAAGLDPAYLTALARRGAQEALTGAGNDNPALTAPDENDQIDPAVIEAIRAGIADEEAGRTMSFDEFKARGRDFARSRGIVVPGAE